MKRLTAAVLITTVLVFIVANSFTYAAGLSGEIKGISHFCNGECEEILISIGEYNKYNVFRLSDPDRIVIDISGAHTSVSQQKVVTEGVLIKSVRHAQFKDNTARVVLDVDGNPRFKIDEVSGGLKVYISRTGNFPQAGSQTVDRGAVNREGISISSEFDIEYTSNDSIEEVTISLKSYEGYKVFTLLEPDRIVLDIPDVNAPDKQQKIDIDSETMQCIRYAQNNERTARIVLDMKNNYGFKIKEEKGRLVLSIENPVYEKITLNNGNVTYYNKGDRVYVTLDGVKLTEGGERLQRLYNEKYDLRNNKYTITFANERGEIKSNVIEINDNILKSIEIINNGKYTSIVFCAKGSYNYLPIARSDVNDTAITIMKPASKQDKLVVIDAGHGGREPGAIYGNLMEKDLNLDIALRLNSLLKKENVKTYMIREDDSFVGLYERAYIANNMKAALFLSVHNNAIGDPAYSGTMTLCYSHSYGAGMNGYRFSSIIQNNLLSALGTVDRKIIARPNLVVLKATAMPASLAEIAFMTNSGDRQNLQDETFRQKAAQALCNAVMEALKEV